MKVAYLFVAGLFLVAVSCERHSWEDTKALHEQHGHGGHDEATGHDSDAGEHGEAEGNDKDGDGHEQKPEGEAEH